MFKETIIGFDSAWTDNAPGAICCITLKEGALSDFCPPRLVNFDEAADLIKKFSSESDFTLVALDQPTIVPNYEGMRPVERVAGSIVNSIGGGVQPANRSKASMFGEEAPIWRFLNMVGARENPPASRVESQGLFLVEVFPALALPTLVPEIWTRRRAVKYNPAAGKFSMADWCLVTTGIHRFSVEAGLTFVAAAARELCLVTSPRKRDQDKLDALICLLIGWTWRKLSKNECLSIGDPASGYMVTPATSAIRAVLSNSAERRGVPIDYHWQEDADTARTNTVSSASPEQKAKPKSLADTPTNDDGRKICPECGRPFNGDGWLGIDAHWKAKHENIMPYHKAWPIIKSGGKPSAINCEGDTLTKIC